MVSDEQRHIKMLEQNIERELFDGIYLEDDFSLPALVFATKDTPYKSSFRILKNTVKLTEGNTSLYLKRNDKLIFIGKVEYSIDIVFRLENIFSKYGLKIFYCESKDKAIYVESKDLLGTIKL